jgi:asparagine synthase (glutamine-hydrolysing)
MIQVGGLYGLLAPAGIDQERLRDAGRRAPWRGGPTTLAGRLGAVVGLGAAAAARHEHLAVVLHGRIDNAEAMAAEFGCPPDDPTLLIAQAYLRLGDGFARHLVGDFAILVLDDRRGTLLGVRDWIGARPLFWGERDGVVAFASEVKQVLALLDRPFRLHEATAEAFAAMERPASDATFADGVLAVLPSGQVLAEPGVPPQPTRRPVRFEPLDLTLPEAAALVRQKLEVAVSRRTAGAQKLGAFCSGGMDSTALVGIAASLAQRGAGPPVAAAITATYPTAPETDEGEYAREVAKFWGIKWISVSMDPRYVLSDQDTVFAVHDGPTFPGNIKYHLMNAARRAEIDVALSGEMADWWLDQPGYRILLTVLRGEWIALFLWLRREGRATPTLTLKRLGRALDGRLFGQWRAELFFERQVDDFWLRFVAELEEREAATRGIRVELPFGDFDLVSVLAGLPQSLRSLPGRTKIATREALQGLLPASVLTRQDVSFTDQFLSQGVAEIRSGQTILTEIAGRYIDLARDAGSSRAEL